MGKPYSYDLRQKVLQAIELDGLTKTQASALFNISRNTINLWFQRRANTGDIKPLPRPAVNKSAKLPIGLSFAPLLKSMAIRPNLRWRSYGTRRLVTAPSPRALQKLGFTRKKTYGYLERDEAERAAFLGHLADPKAAHLVYVDESGMDERDDYGYGYAPAGERFIGMKAGRRQGRINMIAGYRDGQLIAPFTIEGACNRSVFEVWLTRCLIPLLKPGEWVILDNATFHHGGRIAELIEGAGAQVLYLPPYSPDLNRIEKCWAWLKSRIRKQLGDYEHLREAMEAVLEQASS